MGNLSVAGTEKLRKGRPDLLPIEKEVEANGVMTKAKIEYLAECTASKEEIASKSNEKFLRLTWSIDYMGERHNIKDVCFYGDTSIWRISKLINLLNLNPDTVTEEDFVGQFMFITLKINKFIAGGAEVEENICDAHIRKATPEEVNPPSTGDENPF